MNTGRGKAGGIYRVESIVVKKGKPFVNYKKIYTLNKKGNVTIKKATHFMENASIQSGKKLDEFFVNNAKKRIKLK